MKGLTAQEALERFGFIVHGVQPPIQCKVGDVLEMNDPECTLMPLGTKLVLVEEIDTHLGMKIWQECKWDASALVGYRTFKAVAE
jgi:hypothetical protein